MFNFASIKSLSTFDIQQGQAALQAKQAKQIEQLEELLKHLKPLSEAEMVQNLNYYEVDAETQLAILEAYRKGDAAKFEILYRDATGQHNPARHFAQEITVQNKLNELKSQNANGTLTPAAIDSFVDLIQDYNYLPKGKQGEEVLALFDSMKTIAQVQAALAIAIPNAGAISINWGPVFAIHNPSIPVGIIVNLGKGNVMVGTGGVGHLACSYDHLASVIGLPVATTPPVPDSDSKVTNNGVVLRSGNEVSSDVSYVINDRHTYTMKPGHSQSLGSGKWIIKFDRGGNSGTAAYTLTEGTYEFAVKDNGWDLVRKSYEVTIDNSANSGEFHYVLDNEEVSVAPHQTETHRSPFPMEIRFDRGDGESTGRKILTKGVYQVAISPSDNLWDLYSAEQSEPGEPGQPSDPGQPGQPIADGGALGESGIGFDLFGN